MKKMLASISLLLCTGCVLEDLIPTVGDSALIAQILAWIESLGTLL